MIGSIEFQVSVTESVTSAGFYDSFHFWNKSGYNYGTNNPGVQDNTERDDKLNWIVFACLQYKLNERNLDFGWQ